MGGQTLALLQTRHFLFSVLVSRKFNDGEHE